MPSPNEGAPPDAPAAVLPALRCDTVGPTVADGRRGWYLGHVGAGDTGERCFVPAGAGSCASPIEFPDTFLPPPCTAAIGAVSAVAEAAAAAGATSASAAKAGQGPTRAAAEEPAMVATEGPMRVAGPSPCSAPSPVPLMCGEDGPETELIRTSPIGREALTARLQALSRAPITGRFLKDVVTHPLRPPRPLFQGGGSLMYERSLVRLLGLTHNTLAGAVQRETDLYDVLGVSRVTVGTCIESDCADVSAVAVAGVQARDFAWRQLPLLMLSGDLAPHTAARPGVSPVPSRQHTVSMGDEGVLTLGWGVLSNPAWLRPAASEAAGGTATAVLTAAPASFANAAAAHRGTPWDLRARVTLDTSEAPGRHYNPTADYYLDEDDTNVSSRWLPAILGVLCRDPIDSFVRLHHVVCGCGRGGCHAWWGGDGDRGSHNSGADAGADLGETRRGVSSPTSTPADHLEVLGAATGGTTNPDAARRSSTTSRVAWFISPRIPADPEVLRPEPCPPLAELGHSAPHSMVWRPPWVAARGVREINRESSAEAALAAAFRPCLLDVAQVAPREPQAAALLLSTMLATDQATHFTDVEEEMQRFSNAYDRRVFHVEPPPEPTAMGPLLLALIVFVPEAIAVISVLIASPQVGRRELVLATLFFVAGLVSSGGIILLAVTESHGASWRAAAERDSLRLDLGLNATTWANRDIRLTGVTDLQAVGIYRTQTIVVIARKGYHPKLLVGLAIAFSVVYVGLSGAVVSLILRQAGRPPPPPPHMWSPPRLLVLLFAKKRGVRRWLSVSRRQMAAADR
ncbi:hypothetical protein MMPV_008976 [Pyropia vietnamensis]